MIRCESISRHFGNLAALDRFSLSIVQGQVCSILGPNGAGKSTLIRILTGLDAHYSGTVSVLGYNPSGAGTRNEMRRRIGVVPESLALLPELMIAEQLQLSGPLYGLDRQTTRSRAEDLLEVFGLADKQNTLARECSHGMRKKTALCLAMLHNPAVLILDEPFEGVDPSSVEVISNILRRASQSGITILLTSHILSLVEKVSDRVVLIKEGRILRDEDAEALRETSVEKLYFETLDEPAPRELAWLRWQA